MGPTSWRSLPAEQQPEWPDEHALEQSLKVLSTLPPLVFAGEARALRSSLAEVAAGRAFLLQAGDCAESFNDFTADSIRDKLKVILQMAVVLTYGTGTQVVKVGRIAGQFAKPRSSPYEMVDGVQLPAFRGHIVNDDAPTLEARRPDPQRLIAAYHQSASTLNLLRAFTKGGFADLAQVHMWNQEFVASSREGQRYENIAGEIDRALRFMAACGIDLKAEESLHQVDFYTSHEALILGYEEALTRKDSLTGGWYDTSAHLVWCGERTRQLDGAHLHFLSGINNPVAAKVGPNATPEDLPRYLRHPRPRARAGAVDPHQPYGRDQGRGPTVCATARREGFRAPGRVGLRPDARQYFHFGRRPQDPPFRRRAQRDLRVFCCLPGERHVAGRGPRGAHRRQRHRVPRRR